MDQTETLRLINSQIDQWLILWHTWASREGVGRGYPKTAAGCSMYRASRQYDNENGSLDHEADETEAKAIDTVIQRMSTVHRAALGFEARNLCTARVWRSARMDQELAQLVTQEARGELWSEMNKAGLA